ncbi:MAG: hypothetical protein Q9162_000818 [Coniocarpon cinnabarinum]
MIVMSGAFAIPAIIISLFTTFMHLTHQGNHREQKLILRILLLPLSWSLFAFGGVWNYDAAIYLDPVPLLLEAVAVAAMFELFVTMLVPDRENRENFFDAVDMQDRKGNKISDDGSLQWFKQIYVRVYQFPVVFVLMTIVSEGLSAANCPTNHIYEIVHVVVQVIEGVSTALAIIALLCFCRRFNKQLKPFGALRKFLVLKGIVGLTTLQKFVIGILDRTNTIDDTLHISLYDWEVGFPDMLITFEMLLAAIGFVWAYSWLPYTEKRMALLPRPTATPTPQTVSGLRLILEGLYFPDFFGGCFQAGKYALELFTGRGQGARPRTQGQRLYTGNGQADASYARLVSNHSPPRPSTDGYELPPRYPGRSDRLNPSNGTAALNAHATSDHHSQTPQYMHQSLGVPRYTQ